jgi:hypothetical protein
MKCLWWMVAGAGLAAGAASAQTVYRCGSEYTRIPCAAGRLVDVSDRVSAEQRAQAQDAARREAQLGEAMARDRRAEAAAFRPALAANIGPVKAAPAPAAKAKKKVRAKRKAAETIDGDFVARVPKTKSAG